MKLPFSYEHDFFRMALLTSFLSHVGYVAASGTIIAPAAQFTVEQAPSSLEIVIVNEDAERNNRPTGTILTIEAEDAGAEAVENTPEIKKQPSVPLEKIHIPERWGALEEVLPQYAKNPAPRYPEYARRHGWEGVVIVDVMVERSGTVSSAGVIKSSGYQILDDAALETIKQWIFQPARIGHFTWESNVKIPVRFTLDAAGEIKI